jgi:hypothetical protein
MDDTKQGVKMIFITKPYDEVDLHIIIYITFEGRPNLVHSYHLSLLYQFMYYSYHNLEEKLIVSHFMF